MCCWDIEDVSGFNATPQETLDPHVQRVVVAAAAAAGKLC